MNTNTGYQPAPGTTVVVVSPQTMYGRGRTMAPAFLRQGIKIGGVALSFHIVICLGLFGGFFLFAGIIAVATANHNSEFWERFDRSVDPALVMGIIFLIVGGTLVAGCVVACVHARKKYHSLSTSMDNPGRVISQNPGQPGAAYPPPGQPGAAYPPPGQPGAAYPPPGQPGAAYPPPGQPGAAYPPPGQPGVAYPPGQPGATYPGQPSAPYAPQPAAYPAQPGQLLVNYQMIPPGQSAPQASPGSSYPLSPPGAPAGPYPSPSTQDTGAPHQQAGPLPEKGPMPYEPESQPPPAYAPGSNPPPYAP